MGKKPNSKAEDCVLKMLTKQEIKTKTPAGVRELPIPDYVFEAILEEVIPKERKDHYYDYSEVIEIDLILEEYFLAFEKYL